MITDLISNKKLYPIVTEPIIRGKRLKILHAFIKRFYFITPKDLKLKSAHYFNMKVPKKRKLQQITINHSSDTDFKEFMTIYKKKYCKKVPF